VSQTPFAIANFRQSAVAMRVKAGGNAADDTAGNGAREVTIQGIDSNFAELSEAVATAGASASAATSATFWRVHRAWVSASGTYTAANTANIVIEDSGSGADFLTITAEEGQSQIAGFTIPAGKTGYLVSVHVTVSAGNLKTSNVKCIVREEIDTVAVSGASPVIVLTVSALPVTSPVISPAKLVVAVITVPWMVPVEVIFPQSSVPIPDTLSDPSIRTPES
ncbi:unnamed protein product, partial [marine sediment metagenome]